MESDWRFFIYAKPEDKECKWNLTCFRNHFESSKSILFVVVFFLCKSSSGGTLKDFNGEVASQAQAKTKDKVSRLPLCHF